LDNITQLSTYYDWGIEKTIEPLCFLVVPNYRYADIIKEISQKDSNMQDIYIVIKYGEIAEFIEEEYRNNNIPKTYSYYSLIPQIIDAFKNLSHETKEDLYARMFLEATN